MMKDYKDVIVWQRSMQLAEEIYKLTKRLPKEEQFGLSGQLRRASVSIPSNIAEGYGRESKNEYLHFLKIARGSLYEVETQLLLCVRVGLFEEILLSAAFSYCSEIGKMLNVLIRSVLSSCESLKSNT